MRFNTELIALKIDNDSNDLVEILLAVTGEWNGHAQGAFRIDKADLEKMKLNFQARKIDTVIDYEHQSLYGEQAPAAGWIKELIIKDDKLYGMVSWTQKAKEYIKNAEYRYLSPVFDFGAVDKKTGVWIGCELTSVALTNTPFLDELGEVKANKNLNSKGENMDKTQELQAEILALKAELDEAKKKNESLIDEVALSKVTSAIVANKITKDQKAWALKYAKSDMAGFDEFVASAKAKEPNIMPSDMFANKAQAKDEVDVVKFALTSSETK